MRRYDDSLVDTSFNLPHSTQSFHQIYMDTVRVEKGIKSMLTVHSLSQVLLLLAVADDGQAMKAIDDIYYV